MAVSPWDLSGSFGERREVMFLQGCPDHAKGNGLYIFCVFIFVYNLCIFILKYLSLSINILLTSYGCFSLGFVCDFFAERREVLFFRGCPNHAKGNGL